MTLEEEIARAREDYSRTRREDWRLIRHLVYRLFQDQQVKLFSLEETEETVTMTVARAVRFVRHRRSGEVVVEENTRWHADRVSDFRALVGMLDPTWAPFGDNEDWAGFSSDYRILGPGSYTPFLHLTEWLADAALRHILTMVRQTDIRFLDELTFLDCEHARQFYQHRRVLVNTLWGSKQKPVALAKLAYKALWRQVLDPDVRTLLGHYLFHLTASLPLYNRLAQNRANATQRLRETPQLAKAVYYHRSKGDPFAPDAVARLKQDLKQSEGLTEQGWRWMTRQTAAFNAELAYRYAKGFALLANWSAEFKLEPPFTFFQELHSGDNSAFWKPLDRLSRRLTDDEVIRCKTQLGYLYRVLASEAIRRRKRGQLTAFMEGEFRFVMDWLRDLPHDQFLSLPLKQLTFTGLNRRQEAWHAEMLLRENHSDAAWTCLITAPQEVSEGVTLVPLLTADALYQEGSRLHHCVGSYAERCQEGRSRIFSLRNPQGKSLATLELTRWDGEQELGRWKLNQLRGPCNKPVKPEWTQAARSFTRAYQKKWSQLTAEEQSAFVTPEPVVTTPPPPPVPPRMPTRQEWGEMEHDSDIPF